MLVFVEGWKLKNPVKNPQSKDENQQQTQPKHDSGSGNLTQATLVRGECFHHCATPSPLSLDHWPVSVCYVMSHHVTSCHVMLCRVVPCHVMSCHVMSCEHMYMYFINMTVTLFAGSSLGLNMHVFGTETHMTAIVGMALGKREIPKQVGFDSNAAANMFFNAQNKVRAWTVKTTLSFPVKSFLTRVSKVICVCFGFVLLLLVIGLQILCHFFSQLEVTGRKMKNALPL